jgi:hypothetical protein
MDFISAGSIYAEVDCSFEISHKVYKLICEKLNEKIKADGIFKSKYEGYQLDFITSTRSDLKELLIMGPTISKRYKVVEYVLYVPYYPVIDSVNYLKTFLDYYEEGVQEVLKIVKIDPSPVAEIFELIRKQVVSNPDYERKRV